MLYSVADPFYNCPHSASTPMDHSLLALKQGGTLCKYHMPDLRNLPKSMVVDIYLRLSFKKLEQNCLKYICYQQTYNMKMNTVEVFKLLVLLGFNYIR